MDFTKIKTICILSNGSLFLANSNFIKFKNFKLIKKDLLSNNITKISKNYKEVRHSLNYVSKYLEQFSLQTPTSKNVSNKKI